MQYSSVFLAALAATTTLAAPWTKPSVDNKLQVVLSGPHVSPVENVFPEGQRDAQRPSRDGPFEFVELSVGKNVQNQAYRCQILDHAGKPIVLQRGANTDITFADGDNGRWTFRAKATKVSKVICDPTFKKIDQSEAEIRVQLSNQGSELGIQTAFKEGERQVERVAPGPFTSIDIRVGALVQKQDYRCQVLDKAGKPIVATRGANRDITFSDADKGEWRFEKETETSQVICDPAFKSGSA
ncbi:MAG: hypothetical protein Q9166_006260 [cf. Caloplaca sp. 2 TL-2023]